MNEDLQDVNRNILDILLEDVAEKTKLGVVFVHNDEQIADAYQYIIGVNFSRFCSAVGRRPELARLCSLDHQKRGLTVKYANQVEQCHLGLFNISFPISLKGEVIASLLLGQRKIIGREEESQRVFEKFLEGAAMPKRHKIELKEMFDSISPIEPKYFGYSATFFTKSARNILQNLLTEEKYYRARVIATTHELLLPMQALTIEAENLREETYEQRPDLDYIREGGSKILFEVSKLSMYASNMRKMMIMPVFKPKHHFRLIPVYALLDQAGKRFEVEASEKQIKILRAAYISGSFPTLPLVEEEILIALNNVYSNALKYSHGQTRYTKERYITTDCYDEIIHEETYFVIKVSNFGVGILQDEIDSGKIFTSGYRGILSRDRNRTGSGVGLYLIKEIVERIHNGKVEITSTDKKSGFLTEVKLKLPFLRKDNENIMD